MLAERVRRVLEVGPGREFLAPSMAASAAQDDDIVEIAAGVYPGDVAVWKASRLLIRGVGGKAHLRADGKSAEGKAIWVIQGNDTVVEGITFSGAKVADRNGAGIRQEGRGLVIKNCLFHDNENGILTSARADSEILIVDSEFARNGAGDGQSHNIYIGQIAKFTLRRSYVHHAVVGHNVKSRAAVNVVIDNRIADEDSGNASYDVEFPNGGKVLLAFNVIQQGPRTDNATMVSFGAEGNKYRNNEFVAKGNTFINQHPPGGRFVSFASPISKVSMIGNVFFGPGELPRLPGFALHNEIAKVLPGNANWRPAVIR